MPADSRQTKSSRTPNKNLEASSASESDDVDSAGRWARGLSKGVFAFKKSVSVKRPPAKSPKNARKRPRHVGGTGREGEQLLAACLASRSAVRVEERVVAHQTLLVQAEQTVEHLQREMFSGVFDSLAQFVGEAGGRCEDTTPCAVLLTGVNMPDHTKVFSQLCDRLASVSPHLALVQPGLALRGLVQHIVTELSQQAIKKTDACLAELESWYEEEHPTRADRPPLIVILQDFEGSSGPGLADLITLLRRYRTLPVVMVFGVATTVTIVHRALPQAATARLTIHTFGSPAASKMLDQVIEKVIINPDNPFKLSHRVFQFLLENFLFHDFAVRHFLEGYKFILGEHFYRSSAAALCCELKVGLPLLDKLTDSELDSLRRLPSFRHHCESLPAREAAALLVDRDTMLAAARELLTAHQAHTRTFTVLVRLLHHLVHDLPRKPLGRQVRDQYELCLKGDVTEMQQFKEAWQFLKLSARVDLDTKVGLIVEELETAAEPALAGLLEQLKESQVKLAQLEEVPSSAGSAAGSLTGSAVCSPGISALPTPVESAVGSPARPAPLPGKLDRYKLQRALLAAVKDKQRAPARPYDLVRTELLATLHSALASLLTPPSTLPLHEVYTFTAVGPVRRHLVGAPRAALHTALTDPWEYLESAELKIQDQGEIPASLPDLCIGYKLHLECPRLINLYDWLVCWNSIVTGGQETEKPDPVSQARFARVVQELQYLGFIRSSTRKTDHVARLTFGGS